MSLLTVVMLAASLAALTSAALARGSLSALAQGHDYRRGVVPILVPGHPRSAAAAATGGNLAYRGGNFGVGVTTGRPRVYLVFWGSQWGAQSTNPQGYLALKGDPKGEATDLQAFFTGLGTGGETWSGVMTQYCEGIAAGLRTCPSSAAHVGYPTGGSLAAVWADEAVAAPAHATQNQLAAEAVRASQHFGNTASGSNRNVQYFVVSPTGTHPDGFNTVSSNFCAWHFMAGSATNKIAYTNMPYIPDAGASCGQSFVNPGSAGVLDGVTIVGGHEYAETITDQFPSGGWTDSIGNENGDKCAWIRTGQGASQNLVFSTGSFPIQSTWANDFNAGAGGCEVSHQIIGANAVTVTNPGSQTGTVGRSVSLQVQASDSAGATLTYSAAGLPAGLQINTSTGLISGSPTAPGTSNVTVSASDGTGASGSASFTWTVGATCAAQQLLGNPGFETGSAAPWASTPGIVQASSASEPSHSGNYDARFGGHGKPTSDKLNQTVTLPGGCASYQLSFWLHIDTSESSGSASDTFAVQLMAANDAVIATLATYSNLNAAAGYQLVNLNMAAYAGRTVHLRFLGTETNGGGGTTNFVLDDTALSVS